MMKKLVSVLLLLAMMSALIVPMTVSAADADATQPTPTFTFDDWKDPCAHISDKYQYVATSVMSVNNNPVLSMFPLRGDKGTNWNHIFIPFAFEGNKTYVISYDVAVMESPKKEKLTDAKLYPVITSSEYASDNNNSFPKVQPEAADQDLCIVKAGKWNHIQLTLKTNAVSWMNHIDYFGFYEVGDYANINTHFAIDNLVIMEQGAFNVAYPNGVAARTDDPTVGFDKIMTDFNTSRFTAMHSINWDNKVTMGLRGDAFLTWNKAANSMFIPFAFTAGKTYKVAFDMTFSDSKIESTKVYAAASDLMNPVATDESGTIAKTQNFKSGNDEFATVTSSGWTHVEMTLTVDSSAAYKYFTMWQEQTNVTSKAYIDNFAVSEISVFPTNMKIRTTPYTDTALLVDFEDGEPYFCPVIDGRAALSVEEVNKNGVVTNVLKVAPKLSQMTQNKMVLPYAFVSSTASATSRYVISFDVMVYGGYDGAPAQDTELAVFAVDLDYTLFDNAGKCVELGRVQLKAGEWTHFHGQAVDIGTTANRNYFAIQETNAKSNANNGYYIDNLTIIQVPATACTETEHASGLWITTQQPTCAAKGTSTHICALCDKVIETKELPANTHVYGEWATVKEATCTEAGTRERVCTVCNIDKQSDTIPASGHIPGEKWNVTKEATCHEEGSRCKTCTVCNQEVSVEAVPKLLHVAGSWVVDKEAEAGVAGHRYKVCTICNEKVAEEEIPALKAPETTDAPTTGGNTGSSSDGCKSVVGGEILILISVLSLAAVMICKKKAR